MGGTRPDISTELSPHRLCVQLREHAHHAQRHARLLCSSMPAAALLITQTGRKEGQAQKKKKKKTDKWRKDTRPTKTYQDLHVNCACWLHKRGGDAHPVVGRRLGLPAAQLLQRALAEEQRRGACARAARLSGAALALGRRARRGAAAPAGARDGRRPGRHAQAAAGPPVTAMTRGAAGSAPLKLEAQGSGGPHATRGEAHAARAAARRAPSSVLGTPRRVARAWGRERGGRNYC